VLLFQPIKALAMQDSISLFQLGDDTESPCRCTPVSFEVLLLVATIVHADPLIDECYRLGRLSQTHPPLVHSPLHHGMFPLNTTGCKEQERQEADRREERSILQTSLEFVEHLSKIRRLRAVQYFTRINS
jgi:hypothetical protein